MQGSLSHKIKIKKLNLCTSLNHDAGKEKTHARFASTHGTPDTNGHARWHSKHTGVHNQSP